MTWGLAQAGNRASKSGCHLQWRDTESECQASASDKCKVHNSALFSPNRGRKRRGIIAETWERESQSADPDSEPRATQPPALSLKPEA